MAIQQIMVAQNIGGGGGSSFNTLMATSSPLLWYKLDETSGTTAADSSGNGYNGALQGGGTFATAGASVAPASGYAGLDRGLDLEVATIDRVKSPTNAALAVGTSASGAWTIMLFVTGAGNAATYLFNRQNQFALVYDNTTASAVQPFSIGYTGTNPATGAAISLSTSDTTTPHQIVYRYNNGAYSGFKDGASVFSLSSSFALPGSTQYWNLGAHDSGGFAKNKVFDCAVWNRALTDTEIADLWAARNTP